MAFKNKIFNETVKWHLKDVIFWEYTEKIIDKNVITTIV